MWRWGGARAVGVCGIGAMKGAGPTLPPGRAVMWGMEQMPAAPAQNIAFTTYTYTKRRYKKVQAHFKPETNIR